MHPAGERGLGLPTGRAGGPGPGAVSDHDTSGGDAAGLPERVAHECPRLPRVFDWRP